MFKKILKLPAGSNKTTRTMTLPLKVFVKQIKYTQNEKGKTYANMWGRVIIKRGETKKQSSAV